MPQMTTAWLSAGQHATCTRESNCKLPLESGGVFMGYWHDLSEVVITKLIGPGPKARHGHHYFEPDQDWQLSEIEIHYEQSGYMESASG